MPFWVGDVVLFERTPPGRYLSPSPGRHLLLGMIPFPSELSPREWVTIRTKWVFRNKVDKKGNVIKNKARLVAIKVC